MTDRDPRRFALALKALEVRMRFVVIVVVTGLFVTNRDALVRRITQFAKPPVVAPISGTNDEWYCPMDRDVVRDSAGTCPLCGMKLSSRERSTAHDASPRVRLSKVRVERAGIEVETVGARQLVRELRVLGTVEVDDRRRFDVPARVHARVDTVSAPIVGQEVKRGDELATIYSPDLVNAQQIYLQLFDARDHGKETAVGGELPFSQRERASLLGVSDIDLKELERTHNVVLQIPVRSPADGTILEKNVVPGHYVNEGDALFRLADLRSVFVVARVFVDDIGSIAIGQTMEIRASTLKEPIDGSVAFIAPVADARTRTVSVRADVSNEERSLKPGMFVDVLLRADVEGVHPVNAPEGAVLAISDSCVIATGTRRFVYVERAAGEYEAVEVELGPHVQDAYPVIRGLVAGDRVVGRGAFLLDAESRLRPDASPTSNRDATTSGSTASGKK